MADFNFEYKVNISVKGVSHRQAKKVLAAGLRGAMEAGANVLSTTTLEDLERDADTA